MPARHNQNGKVSASQRKATDKFQKEKTRQIPIKLHTVLDADILAFLDEVENRQGLIKKLLRDEIRRKKPEKLS